MDQVLAEASLGRGGGVASGNNVANTGVGSRVDVTGVELDGRRQGVAHQGGRNHGDENGGKLHGEGSLGAETWDTRKKAGSVYGFS